MLNSFRSLYALFYVSFALTIAHSPLPLRPGSLQPLAHSLTLFFTVIRYRSLIRSLSLLLVARSPLALSATHARSSLALSATYARSSLPLFLLAPLPTRLYVSFFSLIHPYIGKFIQLKLRYDVETVRI